MAACLWLHRNAKSRICLLLALLFIISFGGQTACAQTPSSSNDASQVKAHLKEILAQPEFHPDDANGPLADLSRSLHERWEHMSQWLQERWKAFQRFLQKLFSFAGSAGGPIGAFVSYIFVVVATGAGIALAGWLIAWIIRSSWLNRKDRKSKERAIFDESEGDEAMVTEPEAWLGQARQFADDQDYRRAFRCVFMAILLLMDQGGLIEFDRSRTNGDYLRLLRLQNLTRLFEALRPLVIEFDKRWYRRDDTDESDYKRILEEFDRIRTLMTQETSNMTAGGPQTAAGKA